MSILCFLTISCQVLTCSDTWAGPTSPTSFAMLDIHFDGSHYWAVGDHGAIYKSQNGLSWERKITNCFVPLSAIASNGNHLVAVGVHGTILESLDGGEQWIPKSSGVSEDLNGVFFGNNRFLTFGDDGILLARYSTWLEITSNATEDLLDGINNNGRNIIVGRNGTVITSNDDLLWNFRPTSATGSFQTVVANGIFAVAAGTNNTIYRSINNGINWNQVSEGGISPPSFKESAYIQGEFHLLADQSSYVSSDTLNWNHQASIIDRPSGIFEGAPNWIACNQFGQFFLYLGAGTWQETGSFHRNRFFGLHKVGNQLLAFGEMLSSSSDGENWSSEPLPGSSYYIDAASLNGATVLAGFNGMIYSNDLTNWSECTVPSSDLFNGISAGNGKWVAIGYNGLILNTSNPSTWQESTTPVSLDKLSCVSYFNVNQCFIAGGESGSLFFSIDGGTTWQESPDSGTLTTATLVDFHEFDGTIFALCADGKILDSTNGQDWSETLQTISGSFFGPQKIVNFQGGLYILGQRRVAILVKTGPTIRDATMRMISVKNLTDWEFQYAIGHANPQSDIIVFQDKIFSVGRNGSIHSFISWSSDFPNWPSKNVTELLQTMHNCWQ